MQVQQQEHPKQMTVRELINKLSLFPMAWPIEIEIDKDQAFPLRMRDGQDKAIIVAEKSFRS